MAVLEDLTPAFRAPAGEPVGAIVLLHGAGADERDPLALVDVLDPERRFGVASPRGTMNVPGRPGHQWFVDREPGYPQRDTFEQTYQVLGAWLASFSAKTGIPLERTILGGMSQGATMAWALALGQGRPRLGGLLTISGYIPRVSDFELDYAALDGLAVAICHGTQDTKVPVDLARSAKERAEEAGADVLYRETDVPHILDPRVVPELIGWLSGRFQAP